MFRNSLISQSCLKIKIFFRLNSLLEEIGNSAEYGSKTIIFVETKKKVENVTKNIRKVGWPAVCMHGDKSQQERDYVLREFRNGRSNILVATDVAARGLGKHNMVALLLIKLVKKILYNMAANCVKVIFVNWNCDGNNLLIMLLLGFQLLIFLWFFLSPINSISI